MIRETVVVLITLLLIACASKVKSVPDSDVTSSASASPADTVVTSHNEDGKLLPDSMRIKFDVDTDGRVQNIQVLESTTTAEVEYTVTSKMKNEWRYEKGKSGTDLRVVVYIKSPQTL